MKKFNLSILIVSIASAVVILGACITLGLRFGIVPGLLTGVGAFTLLIACMLFANRKMNKPKSKEKQKKQSIKKTKQK